MDKEIKFEIKRKFIHLLIGFVSIILIYFLGTKFVFYFSLVIFSIMIYLRAKVLEKKRVLVLSKLIDIFERKEEKENEPGKGAMNFALSIILITSIFEKNTCILSILILSISDTMASIVGKKFGRIKIKENKTLEGCLSFFISSLIICLFFMEIKKAIAVSLFAVLLELIVLLDDNLSIPLGVSFMVSMIA